MLKLTGLDWHEIDSAELTLEEDSFFVNFAI
jgi:hypothetical protein